MPEAWSPGYFALPLTVTPAASNTGIRPRFTILAAAFDVPGAGREHKIKLTGRTNQFPLAQRRQYGAGNGMVRSPASDYGRADLLKRSARWRTYTRPNCKSDVAPSEPRGSRMPQSAPDRDQKERAPTSGDLFQDRVDFGRYRDIDPNFQFALRPAFRLPLLTLRRFDLKRAHNVLSHLAALHRIGKQGTQRSPSRALTMSASGVGFRLPRRRLPASNDLSSRPCDRERG